MNKIKRTQYQAPDCVIGWLPDKTPAASVPVRRVSRYYQDASILVRENKHGAFACI